VIKTFRLWRRDAGLSEQEFKWEWLTRQGQLARETIPASPIRRATVSFLGPRQITHYAPGHQLPIDIDFDAVESLYFDSVPDLRSTVASGLLEVLDTTQRRLAQPHPDVPWTVTLEEVMGEAPDASTVISPRGNLKLFRIVSRRRDLDRVQFRIYWHNNHGLMERANPYVRKIFLRTAVAFNVGQTINGFELEPAVDTPDSIDCTNEHYFRGGAEPWVMYETQPMPAESRRDELNFINFEAPVRRALMQEYVLADAIGSRLGGELPR
jgi:hypothetical protein